MPSSEDAFPIHELRVENSGARRSANRVVAQHPEFVIEHRARGHGTNNDDHPLPAVTIESRLWTLDVRLQKHHRPWRRRQAQLVDWRSEVADCRFDLFTCGLGVELHGYGFQVTVADVHPVCHRADPDRGVNKLVVAPPAQDLQRFGLNFPVLATKIDGGKDVIDNVQRRNTGVTCSGQGLHRHNVNRFKLELAIERGHRKYKTDSRAVGIGDDETAAAYPFLLELDGREMIRIDF